jgi:hypothetical protein
VEEYLVSTDKIPGVLGGSPARRRDFLKVAALAGAGVALGGKTLALPVSAATDTPPTIIGVALTAEFLAVTFQTNALANASAIGLTSAQVTTIQAILAEEAIHVRYLQAYGAVAAYGTNASASFSFPAGTFSSASGYATTAVILETAFVAAYMAANRELAANGRADLAQLTYQIGAVEAEHRALSRVIGGFVPYSDVAFEPNLLANVAAGATTLSSLGFLSPTGGNSYLYVDSLTANAISSYSYLLTQTTP